MKTKTFFLFTFLGIFGCIPCFSNTNAKHLDLDSTSTSNILQTPEYTRELELHKSKIPPCDGAGYSYGYTAIWRDRDGNMIFKDSGQGFESAKERDEWVATLPDSPPVDPE